MKFKLFLLMFVIVGFIFSCNQEVVSKSNFIFNQISPKSGLVATIGEIEITNEEFYKGLESQIYEAEMKIFDLKKNRLRALVMEKLMDSDPRKKGLSNDDYLEKYISKGKSASKKEVADFIKKRKIPKEHINAGLKERINKFLLMEKKKVDVEKWMAMKTKKTPVKVFFEKPARPKFDVKIGDAPMMGGKNAKVTIVEFSDFQCPFCVKGHDLVKELKKKYKNKIKVHFKNLPLSFHKHAQGAAEAGLCAGKEGKFWEMHDWMFAHQSELDSSGLKKGAQAVGLNIKNFVNCLDKHEMKKMVATDVKHATDAGVRSTPTFFVNGVMIQGAQSIEVFSEVIDSELNK